MYFFEVAVVIAHGDGGVGGQRKQRDAQNQKCRELFREGSFVTSFRSTPEARAHRISLALHGAGRRQGIQLGRAVYGRCGKSGRYKERAGKLCGRRRAWGLGWARRFRQAHEPGELVGKAGEALI